MGETSTLRRRRQLFWAASGFASDGGYDDAWADATFAGVPYAVPNPPARANALRVHDLHHVLTGYGTDWRGESAIAGWELGSGGGGRHPYAWFIAVFGFVVGLLGLPRRTWTAFRRGRRASNLYRDADPMAYLDVDVADIQAELGITGYGPRRTLPDALAFVAFALITLPLGLLFLAGTPLLTLFAMSRCPCFRRGLRGAGWPRVPQP